MSKKSIADIAKAANVSPATVSRVFNRHPYVKENVKNRVLEVARKLKYAPKFSAAKNNIGIVVNGDEGINLGTFETLIINSLSQIMFKREYAFEIIPHTSVPLLHNSSLRGMISISSKASEIKDLDIPMLTVNHELEGIPSVSTDHRQGTKMAVDYLCNAGHCQIAYLGEPPSQLNWGMTERMEGYHEGIADNHLESSPLYLKKSEETLLESSARILRTGCTAVIVGGEGAALQFCYAMFLMQKTIPEDISVISFETANFSKYLAPPHTTIDQNFECLAHEAVNRLESLIAGNDKQELHVRLGNRIIERESVKKLT
jgi:LacI family transcriptional regulator